MGVGLGVAVGDWGVAVGDSGTLVTSGIGVNVGATTGVAVGTRVETRLLAVGFTDEDYGIRKRRNQIYLGLRVAGFIGRELIGHPID